MAGRSEVARYADLFERVAGQSTVTDAQHRAVEQRVDERGEERAVATYVATTATVQGFEDVIDAPEGE